MAPSKKSRSYNHGPRTTRQHHPDAAGIDIGGSSHYVAVPADRDAESVRSFGAFTEDLFALADWLSTDMSGDSASGISEADAIKTPRHIQVAQRTCASAAQPARDIVTHSQHC